MMQAVDETWWKFWKPGGPEPPMAYWKHRSHPLQGRQQAYKGLNLDHLKRLIQKASVKKAAGHDGWCTAHLKQWPDSLLNWALSLFR